MASASIASHRTFVTMANAPQLGETRGVMRLICPTSEAEYFCAPIWTTQIALKWLLEFDFARSVYGNH
jgi:hypothetical protein